MCDLPSEIAVGEVIVRAARVPQHINEKKSKLRPAAFRPKQGTDDLSVMRKTHLGADKCKVIGKQIHKEAYRGFAALRTEEISVIGAQVIDSREGQYCGHAHISQGFPAPENDECADPAQLERYKQLATAARLYLDANISAAQWIGPEIL